MKNENLVKSPLNEALKGCYGSRVYPSQVKKWLVNNVLENTNRKKRVTLSVNGIPGCGKTDVVKSLESVPIEWNGKKYEGFQIVDIPLAQIEEMGDVLGYPVEEIKMLNNGKTQWIKAVDSLIGEYMGKGWFTDGEQRTIYAPPAWVPKEERPGVLLFDDGNRASQRILRGLMQLVQDYRTISWSVPKGWTIVFTGNPDNRMNQVTSMDIAQLTRMKHITLVPDAKEWALWATENGIDGRVVSWVLKYPEMIVGSHRTNPRTIAEFGRSLLRFKNLNESSSDWILEACASLDEETVSSLSVFLQKDAGMVLSPEVILSDYENTVKPHLKKIMEGKEERTDLVNIMNERLCAYLVSENYVFDSSHIENFKKWVLDNHVPKDTSHSLMDRLLRSRNPNRMKFISGDTRLQKMVRDGMGSMLKEKE